MILPETFSPVCRSPRTFLLGMESIPQSQRMTFRDTGGKHGNTSSSVLGLHFGHYKAVARNDLLSEMHAVFADIAVTTGFSPT